MFWFLLICDLLIPALMIFNGWLMWKKPPKTINWFFGYRTTMSTKNQDTWQFAHDYCGRLWWKLGWWMLIPSALVHIPCWKAADETLGVVSLVLMTLQLIGMLASILPTERALRKTFTKDGLRR